MIKSLVKLPSANESLIPKKGVFKYVSKPS